MKDITGNISGSWADLPESHFFLVDERLTYCDQLVRPDTLLSPDPSCPICRARIAEHDAMLKDLEQPDPADFHLRLEAAALAPYLQRAVDGCRGRAGRLWDILSSDERTLWGERAYVAISICLGEPKGHTNDYLKFAADEARKQFAVMKGGKS